jgi:hypothetical protein
MTRTFRCRADRLHEVDANLQLANPDWEDFAGAVTDGGVFTGFHADAPSPVLPEQAVEAYKSGSSKPVTLTVPRDVVPRDVWVAIVTDLRESFLDFCASAEERKLAQRIYGRRVAPPSQRPGDDVVATVQARDWLFIRERARKIESGSPDARIPTGVGERIISLITREFG